MQSVKNETSSKNKKWREKDKKCLFERIKDKYLLLRRLRVNIIKVDPLKKYVKKSQLRKRSKKKVKKQQHTGGCRAGLRSKQSSSMMLEEEPLR